MNDAKPEGDKVTKYLNSLSEGGWSEVDGIDVPVRNGPRGRRYWTALRALQPTTENGQDVQNFLRDSFDDQVDDIKGSMFFPEESEEPEVNSEPKSPTVPSPQQINEDIQQGDDSNGDCRLLTNEWKEWRERFDRDAYNKQMTTEVSDRPAKLATSAQLAKIVKLLDTAEGIKSSDNISRRKNVCDKLRNWIHEMQRLDVDTTHLATTQILPRIQQFLQKPLTRIQTTTGRHMWIEEELTVLMRRWRRGVDEASRFRGFKEKKKYDENNQYTHSLWQWDGNWPHHLSANHYGEGQGDAAVVNGQTVTIRGGTRRDGMHAPTMAGISGCTTEGAHSVLMQSSDGSKKSGYKNEDGGHVIEYMGTSLKTSTPGKGSATAAGKDSSVAASSPATTGDEVSPTNCTKMLMASMKTNNPVRVIRGFPITKPKDGDDHGYRYDGLYRVTGKKLLNEKKQEWRFHMERIPGQGPLRIFNVDEPKSAPETSSLKRKRDDDDDDSTTSRR